MRHRGASTSRNCFWTFFINSGVVKNIISWAMRCVRLVIKSSVILSWLVAYLGHWKLLVPFLFYFYFCLTLHFVVSMLPPLFLLLVGHEFRDPLAFPVSLYVVEYDNYLNSRCFASMSEFVFALTIPDRNNVARVTSFGALVKRWLQCSGCSTSILSCARYDLGMPFICGDDVENERALWDMIWLYSRRDILEVHFYFVMLRRLYHLLYVIDRLDYWWPDWAFERLLRIHQRPLTVSCHNVKIFAVRPVSSPAYNIITP